MKTATPLLIVTCLTPLLFSACSTGSGYSDSQGYNSGPSGAANPYGVPRAGGEVGSYPQAPTSAENAPYQTLPAIVQAAPPASAPSASAPSASAPTLAPADTLATPSTPITASTTYTVVSGDSLWGIARKYSTSIEAIQSANGLTNTTIRIGQQLTIPGN
jgi:LysM repeat protein